MRLEAIEWRSLAFAAHATVEMANHLILRAARQQKLLLALKDKLLSPPPYQPRLVLKIVPQY